MENEFVPYDVALALKELGFDESCYNQYTDGTLDLPCTKYDYPDCVESIPAPLYQQAFRWFREKYKLHAEIIVQLGFKHWNAQILPSGRWLKPTAKKGFKTYEEAELACLRKLIEIVKDKK